MSGPFSGGNVIPQELMYNDSTTINAGLIPATM